MSDEPAFVWVLNLDAELELAKPGYVRSAKLSAQLAEHEKRAATCLLGPRDELLEAGVRPGPGRVGRAWCPTAAAMSILRRAGVELEPAPSQAVLHTANHRRFSWQLGAGPPGSEFVLDWTEFERALVRASTPRLLKRPLGFAGRGQLRLRGKPSDYERTWIEASFRSDGLLVEALVEPEAEFALHGFLWRDGRFELGRPCVQRVSRHGVWQESALAAPADLEPAERERLFESGEHVARSLAELGYFGPFGIDAYRYRDQGKRGFCALSEINARFTMGFCVGYPEPAYRLSLV